MRHLNFSFISLFLCLFSLSCLASIKIDKVYPTKLTIKPGQSFKLSIEGQSLDQITRAILIAKAKGQQTAHRLSFKIKANAGRAQIELKLNQRLAKGQYLIYLLDKANKKVRVPLTINLANGLTTNSKGSRTSERSNQSKATQPVKTRSQNKQKRQTKQKPMLHSLQAASTKQKLVSKESKSKLVANRNKPSFQGNQILDKNPIQRDSLSSLNDPSAARIAIQSLIINNGEQDTDSRHIQIKLELKNGPITGYRICDYNESHQTCNPTNKPWQSHTSQTINYRLESPNLATYNNGNKPRKKVLVQVKGASIPSPSIRNIMVDNFSTIKTGYISYTGQPHLVSFPAAIRQYQLQAFNFEITNLQADQVTGEVNRYSGNCHFSVDGQSPVYRGEKLSPGHFKLQIFTIGASEASSCTASLKITGFDQNDQEIEYHLLTYTQEFLPYNARYIRVENTAQLFQKLAIEKASVIVDPEQGFTICEGNSLGTSGSKPIGVLIENGDIVFSTRSTSLGRTCIYNMKPRIKPGWMIDMVFEEVKDGDKCTISRDGKAKHIAPMRFTFNRDRYFIGWNRINNVFHGSRQLGNWRMDERPNYLIPTIFMTCKPALSNNHGVKSILKTVVFEVPPNAPEDATWQDAFY